MSTKKKSATQFLKDLDPAHRTVTAMHFRKSAFMDYLAARVLILENMPLQALISASTCVEKYLKAILAIYGKTTRTHLDSEDFYKIFAPDTYDIHHYVNENFVRYLGRAYELRYIEATTGPTSVAVEVRKVLAELDELVHNFENRLVVHQGDLIAATNYQNVARDFNQRIWRENHVLCQLGKTEYVETPGTLWMIVVNPMNTGIEISHQEYRALDDGNFDFPKVHFAEPDQYTIQFSDSNAIDRAMGAARREGDLHGFR
jgi:HEPN domain-containing protein